MRPGCRSAASTLTWAPNESATSATRSWLAARAHATAASAMPASEGRAGPGWLSPEPGRSGTRTGRPAAHPEPCRGRLPLDGGRGGPTG